MRSYTVGEAVRVRNFVQGPTWLTGVVVQNQGQCDLHVKLTDGRVVHHHLDHIRQKMESATWIQKTIPVRLMTH